MRILAVCGSLQRDSGNLRLLQLAGQIMGHDAHVEVFGGLGDLPLFNPDLEEGGESSPAPVERWRQALRAADAVLIASPEYGHSLTGVLKNAIDWVIPSGELYRKPIAITAAVASPDRGLRGLSALKQTLSAVDAVVLHSSAIVQGPQAGTELQTLLSALLEGVRIQASVEQQSKKLIESTFALTAKQGAGITTAG
jgi:NAD(P)H-dependent FMN reductase